MGTSFEDIYELNQSIMEDSRISRLSPGLFYYQMDKYLKHPISKFNKYCRQDLTSYVASEFNFYEFTGTGDNQFTLSPLPNENSSFYSSVDDVESAGEYDSNTGIYTFSSTPITGNVYIEAYYNGRFNVTLTDEEKDIISLGMTIPFIISNIQQSKALNQLVFGTNVGFYSQAQHNKTNKDILESFKKQFKNEMIEYTYYNVDYENLVGDDSS